MSFPIPIPCIDTRRDNVINSHLRIARPSPGVLPFLREGRSPEETEESFDANDNRTRWSDFELFSPFADVESQFENLHLNHDSSNSPEAYRGLLPAIFHPTSEETHTKCTITSTPSFAESSKFPLKSSLSPPTITRSEKDQIGAASQPALSLFSPTSDQRRYFRGFQGPSKSLSLESSKYKCPVGDCPKAYRQSTFLKRHMAIRHGVRHHNSFKESESRVFSKSEPEQKTQTYRCLFAFCRKEYRLLSNLEFHYWKTHGVSPSNILDISDHSVPSISNTVTNTTGTLHGAYQGPSSNEPISTRPPTSHYSKEVALNSRPGLPQRLHISTSVHNQTHHPDEITPRASTSRISYEENNALYDLILKATRSPADRNQFLSLRGAPAERALCAISEVLDSSEVGGNTQPGERLELRRLLSKLSKASGIIPPGLFLNHVFCSDRETLQIGGYADIFRGSYRGQPVALKRLRVSMTMQQNRGYIEEFSREALIWCYLRHPNILPFLGVDNHTFRDFYCMVSPWMVHGNVNGCMEGLDRQGIEVPYDRWLLEIASGLEYLHCEMIAHGDLRGANILIDGELKVRLGDFGLALFADSTMTGSRAGGSIRWTCPQLLIGSIPRPNFESDIYSYGCVCVEICSRQTPFPELTDVQVMAQVTIYGARPARPSGITGRSISDGLWNLVQTCWSEDFVTRPSAQDIVRFHMEQS